MSNESNTMPNPFGSTPFPPKQLDWRIEFWSGISSALVSIADATPDELWGELDDAVETMLDAAKEVLRIAEQQTSRHDA